MIYAYYLYFQNQQRFKSYKHNSVIYHDERSFSLFIRCESCAEMFYASSFIFYNVELIFFVRFCSTSSGDTTPSAVHTSAVHNSLSPLSANENTDCATVNRSFQIACCSESVEQTTQKCLLCNDVARRFVCFNPPSFLFLSNF